MMRRTPFKQARPKADRHAERVTKWPAALSMRANAAIQTIAAPKAAQPKHPRAENRHLLDMARGQPCLLRSPICVGGTESTVACHGAGISNGKGMGYKVGDHRTVWGCWRCNDYTDAYNGATKDQKLAVFMLGTLNQVNEWRLIAAGPDSKDQRAAAWALEQLGATPAVMCFSLASDSDAAIKARDQ